MGRRGSGSNPTQARACALRAAWLAPSLPGAPCDAALTMDSHGRLQVTATEPATLPAELGGRLIETPRFSRTCRNETHTFTSADGQQISNATEVCEDDGSLLDVHGFRRRAPEQQRYSWHADEVMLEDAGNATNAIIAPLRVGERYIFRVAAIHAGVPPPPPPPTYWELLYAQRQLELPELLRDPPPPVPPPPPPYLGVPSAYSQPAHIELSGPGAPIGLRVDHVQPTSLHLSWQPPPSTLTGLWHGDGGARLLGYHVFVSAGESEPSLAAKVTTTAFTLSELRPQTLLRIHVCAENEYRVGLNSTSVSVATAALRATLWTECGFSTSLHQPMAYQGCFRTDADAPDMPPSTVLPSFSYTLSTEECAVACAKEPMPTLFFGLQAGGRCLCADTFGRYGAVDDSECRTPCTGEVSRICGSDDRISIYRPAGAHGIMLGVGTYYTYDLVRMRLPVRSLSAVMLPEGLQLELFTRDTLGGMRLNLTSSVRCLAEQRCVADATAEGAEPAERCVGDVWDDQTASLVLSYRNTAPKYTPRPGAETGARAFAAGTAGDLSRLLELGGDPSHTSDERSEGVPLTGLWRAPRVGDLTACEQSRGGYSSDQICLQPKRMMPSTSPPRRSPFAYLEVLTQLTLSDHFTEQHATRVRAEWRASVAQYARPFFEVVVAERSGVSTTTYSVSGGSFAAPHYTFSPALADLHPGVRVVFRATNISSAHPFAIGTRPSQPLPPSFAATGSLTGLTGTGGQIAFTIPSNFSGRALAYYCTEHSNMVGRLALAAEADDGRVGDGGGSRGRADVAASEPSLAMPSSATQSNTARPDARPGAEPAAAMSPAGGLESAQHFNRSSFEAWFDTWLAGLLHLRPLLSADISTGAPPVLGLNAMGDVVPWAEATAPPLPPHPLPEVEPTEPQTVSPALEAWRTTSQAEPTTEPTAEPIHEPSEQYLEPRLHAQAANNPAAVGYSGSTNAIPTRPTSNAVADYEPFFSTGLR